MGLSLAASISPSYFAFLQLIAIMRFAKKPNGETLL